MLGEAQLLSKVTFYVRLFMRGMFRQYLTARRADYFPVSIAYKYVSVVDKEPMHVHLYTHTCTCYIHLISCLQLLLFIF